MTDGDAGSAQVENVQVSLIGTQDSMAETTKVLLNNEEEEKVEVSVSTNGNQESNNTAQVDDGEEDEELKQIIAQTDASGVALYPKASNDGSDRYREGSGFFAHICLAISRFFCCANDAPVAANRRSMVFGEPILLPPQLERSKGKKCLVLDLDETLVHSSFKPVPNPDYIIPVDIEGVVHHVYVLKRPGVDEFLKAVQELYEVVIFTASLAKYATPLLDQLDVNQTIDYRLFRESCTHHEGNYVKDLALLGRPLDQTIIVDNSPASYMFHPEHAIDISSFIDDPEDRELYYCLSFLQKVHDCDNVVDWMYTYQGFIRQAEIEERQRAAFADDGDSGSTAAASDAAPKKVESVRSSKSSTKTK